MLSVPGELASPEQYLVHLPYVGLNWYKVGKLHAHYVWLVCVILV